MLKYSCLQHEFGVGLSICPTNGRQREQETYLKIIIIFPIPFGNVKTIPAPIPDMDVSCVFLCLEITNDITGSLLMTMNHTTYQHISKMHISMYNFEISQIFFPSSFQQHSCLIFPYDAPAMLFLGT